MPTRQNIHSQTNTGFFVGTEVYPTINLEQPSIIKTCVQPYSWPISKS